MLLAAATSSQLLNLPVLQLPCPVSCTCCEGPTGLESGVRRYSFVATSKIISIAFSSAVSCCFVLVARRTGWELLWGDKGDWSKEKRTPVTDKYKPTFKPWIEVVGFENLVPTVVRVTGGDDSATGKPKMYSIAPAFYEQYVRSPEPPSWLEHLQTLHSKESDPPPRKGVQARQRSEPTASNDGSQPPKNPRSKKNKAAPKRARPTLPRQAKIAAVNATPGQRELLLIQSVQAVHSWASAHGFRRANP